MSSFEIGAMRPVGAIQTSPTTRPADPSATNPVAPGIASTSSIANVETSLTTGLTASAGTAPINTDRTAQIREAVQNGTYPLIPNKIGDAMIAAGALLRKAPR